MIESLNNSQLSLRINNMPLSKRGRACNTGHALTHLAILEKLPPTSSRPFVPAFNRSCIQEAPNTSAYNRMLCKRCKYYFISISFLICRIWDSVGHVRPGFVLKAAFQYYLDKINRLADTEPNGP